MDLCFAIEREAGPAGSTTLLRLSGTLDREAGRQLRRVLRDAFDRARRGRVVVDMAAVDEIGSECIETLLTGYTRALRGGNGFEVVNARGHVRRALAVTGLGAPDDVLYAPAWLSPDGLAHRP